MIQLHPLLSDRWSTRAFDKGHEVTDAQIGALLEAARWAPSASNTQPWRFLVGRRGTKAYEDLFGILAPGNQLWAGTASALILVAAETVTAEGETRRFAQYDTGQAVSHLVAQAGAEGLAVHQMGGFDAQAAVTRFHLPAGIEPMVVVAVGRHDPELELPEPFATRERQPRTRREVAELQLPTPVTA